MVFWKLEIRRQSKNVKEQTARGHLKIQALRPLVPPDLFLFPRWEIVAFLTQYLGLSTSAALGMATGCSPWTTIGGFIYFLAYVCILYFIVYRKQIHTTVYELPTTTQVKKAMEYAHGPTRWTDLLAKRLAFLPFMTAIRQNSDWLPEAEDKEEFMRFLYPFVGELRYQRKAYMVGVYVVLQKLVLG
eukprot:CAMPEP_0114567796 /NCGR_PEP_ID=MMETSP0114-20121206/15687_1 /TAXON_ID=31324 /ORGANISM="Goniomonas sp, Strain m" /LENGTH=186 /DNA_ID=CAMNT_0001754439 /DNA_START=1 /DNA_END=558 /DNA_ORIENTATION=-